MKLNEHPEITALVDKLSVLKKGGVPDGGAPAPKKEAAPKKEGKKDKEAEAPKDTSEEDRKKELKKVMKEGGKRCVEIEGAAGMGGLQFFCTSVDEPEGDT